MTLWLPGMRVQASTLNLMLPKYVSKSAATVRASTTTATADPDLVFTLAAADAGNYALDGFLSCTGAAISAGDIKIGIAYSSGTPTGTWMGTGTDTTAITNVRHMGRAIDGTTQVFGVNGGNFSLVTISGQITISTAGTLSLLWAQNTSNATPTNVRVGSWLKLTRMDL